MTVEDLIVKLQEFPKDAECILLGVDSGGYDAEWCHGASVVWRTPESWGCDSTVSLTPAVLVEGSNI